MAAAMTAVEQGYDCGSDPTESQCGTTTARVKGPGMRRDADNAEAMPALAALDQSRLWTEYWRLQRAAGQIAPESCRTHGAAPAGFALDTIGRGHVFLKV